MSATTAWLHRLEAAWRAQGHPGVDRLQPGLSPAQISAVLDQVGLTPSQEVLDWYGWHDGLAPDRGFECVPNGLFLSLTDAVEIYREDLISWPGELYHPGWLPFVIYSHGGMAVLHTASPAAQASTVASVDHEGQISDVAYRAANLSVLLQLWVDKFTSGTWTWDGRWVVDHSDRETLPLWEQMSELA